MKMKTYLSTAHKMSVMFVLETITTTTTTTTTTNKICQRDSARIYEEEKKTLMRTKPGAAMVLSELD
jgi:hypothetical protein